jgi:hypothetical protein
LWQEYPSRQKTDKLVQEFSRHGKVAQLSVMTSKIKTDNRLRKVFHFHVNASAVILLYLIVMQKIFPFAAKVIHLKATMSHHLRQIKTMLYKMCIHEADFTAYFIYTAKYPA